MGLCPSAQYLEKSPGPFGSDSWNKSQKEVLSAARSGYHKQTQIKKQQRKVVKCKNYREFGLEKHKSQVNIHQFCYLNYRISL